MPTPLLNTPSAIILKWRFCLLALLLGGLGAHWWYALRQSAGSRAWLRITPYIALFPLSICWGWVDVLRYGLMADEPFNAALNPQNPQTAQSNGWVAVFMVLAMGLLATATIASLAMLNQLWTTHSLG